MKVSLGSHFFLWTPSRGTSNVAVVSSHGAMLDSSFAVPPGFTFKFYSGNMQASVGSLDKTLYDDTVRETKRYDDGRPLANTIDDYVLTKFQGKHANAAGDVAETYQQVQGFANEHTLNVVTVRNRKSIFVKKVDAEHSLSRLIGFLTARYPAINEVRCLFCRVEAQPRWHQLAAFYHQAGLGK